MTERPSGIAGRALFVVCVPVVERGKRLPSCYVQGRGRRLKTRFASLLEKERFLESKEKGAPKGVEWSQIGIRRPGFTPPLRSSPVYGRLPGRNRDKLWSYPHFFRRLRGWASRRGVAAWYYLCCDVGWCSIRPQNGKTPVREDEGFVPF